LDRRVWELIDEVRLPVPLMSRRVEPVEGALKRRIWHLLNSVERRRTELAYWTEHLVGVLGAARVAPHHAAHLPVVKGLGERWPGWNRKEGEEAVEVLGGVQNELAVPAHDRWGAVEVPQRWPADDLFYWM